jgi:amidohydrolase
MTVIDRTAALVDASREELIATRRQLHREPELSGQEHATAALIASRLGEIEGVEAIRTGVGGTGVTASIRGAGPGRTLLLRADIDALPIQEATGAPYASIRDGVMHACGHDGHTAILLTVARALAEQRDLFNGTAFLVFQPAEELGSGAQAMIDDGLWNLAAEPVDATLGLHLISGMPVGTVGVRVGPSAAGADAFEIVLTGRGGHGAMPEQTVDPICTAAEMVLALQRIRSRELAASVPAVISVCTVHGGTADNIIPEEVRLTGTIRTYSPEVRAQILEKVERITAGVAAAGGCRYDLEITMGLPPVVNEETMVALVRETAAELVGREQVVQPEPILASDDVALFLDHAPGCYFTVGAGDPERGFDAPHHHPRFDLTEESLVIGATVFAETALRYLSA